VSMRRGRTTSLGLSMVVLLAAACGGSTETKHSGGGHQGGSGGTQADAGVGGAGGSFGDAAGGPGGTGGPFAGTGGGAFPDSSVVDAADSGVPDGGVGDAAPDTPSDTRPGDASNDVPNVADSGGVEPCVVDSIRFIPIPDRVDIVYDAKRCRVYVATKSGWLKSHELRTGETKDFLKLGEQTLLGMDIAPNRDALLVADYSRDQTHNWIHLVDLRTQTSRRLTFPLALGEAGTYTAVFLSDTTALVDSRYEGAGPVPLRRVNLASGSHDTPRSISQNTILTSSADRSVVAFAESNLAMGQFGTYRVADQSFETGRTSGSIFEIAVNRDASQIAVPTGSGLQIFRRNSGFQPVTLLGDFLNKVPVGAVYSPVANVLHVAWHGLDASSIESLDASSFDLLATLDHDPGLTWEGAALGSGRIKTSPDGKVVLATVRDGVKVYPFGVSGPSDAGAR
jgi:hypothetical protein